MVIVVGEAAFAPGKRLWERRRPRTGEENADGGRNHSTKSPRPARRRSVSFLFVYRKGRRRKSFSFLLLAVGGSPVGDELRFDWEKARRGKKQGSERKVFSVETTTTKRKKTFKERKKKKIFAFSPRPRSACLRRSKWE